MIEVKFDELFVPGIEDEAAEVEHLLAEPKNEHVSVDGVFCFDNDNQGKCLKMKDVSCRLESALKADNGGLDFNTTVGGEDDLNFGVLDGFLDEIDDLEDFHDMDGLASPCDDFLLDIEYGGKISELDCSPHKGSHSGNSSSESHSPGFSGASNGAVGVSESSTETMLEPDGKINMQDQDVTCKSHGVFRSKCGCLAVTKDSMCQKAPASLDPRVADESDNDLQSTNKREKSYVGTTEVCARLREKRKRMPPIRYIDESSDPNSRYSKGRQNVPLTSSKDKRLKARSSDDHRHARVMPLALVKEESIGGASTWPPLKACTRRGCPKKKQSISEEKLKSDEEDFTTESEDDSVTTKRSRKDRNDRRKNQRMWSLSEVTNLVDGISRCGAGRWTDIKRLLFSSSTYRTPIDLRDKWRNLLRTSSSQIHNWGKVKQNQKHASSPLPISLLHRVRELATLHPYPKEREPSVSHVIPPTPPSLSEVHPRGRNARRKICT